MYRSFPQKHISESASAMPILKEIPPHNTKNEKKDKTEKENEEKKLISEKKDKNPQNELLQGLNIDDIIIIGIILLLIYEGSDDYLTIGLLAAVLLF